MTTTSSSITTSTESDSVPNDFFSSPSNDNNLMVFNSVYPMQPSPYAPNYVYPTNYFYSVPFWVQPYQHNDHHKKDDQVVANHLQTNDMTEHTLHSPILKSLCSNLNKYLPSSPSKSDDLLLQDCFDGLEEYTKNFNFQFPKEHHRSRKRRRSFSSGCSSDSDFTDVDSDCEATAPPELLMLERSLRKMKNEYENRNTRFSTKSFLPLASTEQTTPSKQFDKYAVNKVESYEHSPNYERVNNNAPIGIQVETDQQGNTIYKVRGKPIKFKVVKNRPKNGLFNKTWEWHFDKLKEFQNRFGHTNVTRSVEGYEDIGTWVAEQRRKIKKGRITLDQFNKLNDVGFEWDRSYYFYNSQQQQKKPKSSEDEEMASLPAKNEEFEIPTSKCAQQPALISAVEPVL